MSKPTESARIADLEAEVMDLRERIHLLECFVDVRWREKAGLTSDDIRFGMVGQRPPIR